MTNSYHLEIDYTMSNSYHIEIEYHYDQFVPYRNRLHYDQFVPNGSIYIMQGRIQDFNLGGAHLKKNCASGGRHENVGVFRMKNHDFTPKNHIFSHFRGARAGCARPCYVDFVPFGSRYIVTNSLRCEFVQLVTNIYQVC